MQQDAARSDGSRYVGTGQTRLHHVHDQNFKPAAPTSGDKIINKRRFSSLVACGRSLAGVKTDVGAFNRRQHMETTNAGVGQGKCVLSQQILVAALGRRKSTEDSSEMVCKWDKDSCGLRAGETNRLVTSAAQRICMVAMTGANSVCRQGRCWVLGAGA